MRFGDYEMSLNRLYLEAFWLDLQQQYEQSEQTVQAFCAQFEITDTNFSESIVTIFMLL